VLAASFDKVLGNSLAPNRIFNAISIRSSRRLRNSLRSDMLADQKRGQQAVRKLLFKFQDYRQ
jgi:hypothetical protein